MLYVVPENNRLFFSRLFLVLSALGRLICSLTRSFLLRIWVVLFSLVGRGEMLEMKQLVVSRVSMTFHAPFLKKVPRWKNLSFTGVVSV